jgi:uncharacterized protein YeeX (DUF496 family)|tara:strand:+ start:1821 stop:1991 length:171 start_codon:yes stop_codon:yes gene_type:complete
MIKDEETGLMIAESKEEELELKTIENTEREIRSNKLAIELLENTLTFLKAKQEAKE